MTSQPSRTMMELARGIWRCVDLPCKRRMRKGGVVGSRTDGGGTVNKQWFTFKKDKKYSFSCKPPFLH